MCETVELYQQLKPQVSYGSEYSDSMDWVRVTLGTFRSKLDELKEYSVKMNAKPLIFKDSMWVRLVDTTRRSKLRESLPSCPNYPKNQGSSGIRNASDRASTVADAEQGGRDDSARQGPGRQDSVECEGRNGMESVTQTVVFEAMQPIIKDCQAIRNNLEQQSTVMKDVEVDMCGFVKSRSSTRNGTRVVR